MMRQLEIQYFFPLTEQIALDLDFAPCVKYAEEKYQSQIIGTSGMVLTCGSTGVAWATVSSSINPSFTINIDATPITIQSKKKPNFLRRYVYKILGMKWKSE